MWLRLISTTGLILFLNNITKHRLDQNLSNHDKVVKKHFYNKQNQNTTLNLIDQLLNSIQHMEPLTTIFI